MIHSVKVTNFKDESVDLILSKPEVSEIAVESIDGLEPEKTSINSTDNQTSDGASFDSAVTGTKNIVFHLKFWPKDGNIERIRHNCYNYFPVKTNVKLLINTDERYVWIDGYVESNLPTIFSETEGADISILCMDPFFKNYSESKYVIKGVDAGFEFPFSNESVIDKLLIMGHIRNDSESMISYRGTEESSVKIKIVFYSHPDTITVENRTNNQIITLKIGPLYYEGHKITNGDYIIIDTTTGKKSATLYTKNMEPYNLDYLIDLKTIEWITLTYGENHMLVYPSNYVKEFSINNNILYGGV